MWLEIYLLNLLVNTLACEFAVRTVQSRAFGKARVNNIGNKQHVDMGPLPPVLYFPQK